MIPLARQIRCVKREIGMRKRVYPNWVAQNRYTQEQADEEIATMEAVLQTLERVNNQGQKELFDV